MIFSKYLLAKTMLFFSAIFLLNAKRKLFRTLKRNPQSAADIGCAYNKFLAALKYCERKKVALKSIRAKYSRCPILPVKREIGQYTVSRKAKEILSETDITTAVERHKNGDWGLITPDDWQKCNAALQMGYGYGYSRHKNAYGRYFCVITDYGRPKTKIVTEEELLNASDKSENAYSTAETSAGNKAA